MKFSYLASTLLQAKEPYVCVPPVCPVSRLHSRTTSFNPMRGDEAILAFTGTRTWRDLLVDDLDVRPVRWENGFVHGGFAQRTQTILHNVTDFLRAHKRIVITGHSLGGACAILAASVIGPERVVCVCTFGTPPVGTRGFARRYENSMGDRTVHYVTPNDIVIRAVPRLYHITGPKPKVLHPSNPELTPWEQHDMAVYREALDLLDL